MDIKSKLLRKLSKIEPSRYHASKNDKAMSMKLKLFLISLSNKIAINKTLHIIPNEWNSKKVIIMGPKRF